MRFFCKPYSVCEQCKVHFEPALQSRHAELCPAHRKPVIELEDRVQRVVSWAKQNWEKLEPQVLDDENKRNAYLQATYANMAQSAQSGMGLYGGCGNPLGGSFGGVP